MNEYIETLPELTEAEIKALQLSNQIRRKLARIAALKKSVINEFQGKARVLQKIQRELHDSLDAKQVEMFDFEAALSPEAVKLLNE